jgi:hypothetical protein
MLRCAAAASEPVFPNASLETATDVAPAAATARQDSCFIFGEEAAEYSSLVTSLLADASKVRTCIDSRGSLRCARFTF